MPLHSESEHTHLPCITQFFLVIILLVMASCAAVKNPPVNTPFVYDNKIKLVSEGLNAEERKLLEEKLYTYIDDSLQVRTKYIVGFVQRVNPPLFDSANISRSINFMNGYLNSIGYYGASFDTFTVKIDTVVRRHKPQLRVTNTFYLSLGKSLKVDRLVYNFSIPLLQHLADSSRKSAFLKRNDKYSKEAIAAELDRLAGLFRNNGFFKMSRSALLAEGDTTDPSLISSDNDPIEQLLQAQKRKLDPRISLVVMQRPGVDSSVFQQYYIDSVFLYPETKVTEEPDLLIKDTTFINIVGRRAVVIRQRNNLFHQRLLRRNNYLFPGRLYNEEAYFRTINSYWKMGPWQQVDVKTFTHVDTVPKVNFHLFLYPARKQNFQVDLEGSQNNNISVSNSLSGKFLALSLNATHRNRNFFKSGTQAATSARFGFELNNEINRDTRFFQTLLVGVNQNFSIPRLLEPFSYAFKKRQDAVLTQISLGTNYTDRFEFYKQYAFNAGLEWQWRKGKITQSFSIPNFESVYIQETDSLLKEIESNPSLKYAFTPGNILSIRYARERVIKFPAHPNRAAFLRAACELAPINFKIFNRESFRFAKIEGQGVFSFKRRRSSWNYRAYAGVGRDISGKADATLPYFRQYVAGGSNSMRAWGLRQLGLGNSIVSDTAGYPDRFGDIQMELNAEYRFRLFRLFGFNIDGTAFMDAGNIWNHSANADGNGKFEIKNLPRDIAMCVGTGIRWDLSYLVIRLDAGYKVKDPVREGDGWMKTIEWNGVNRLGYSTKNVGFQFGIGYPF